MKTTDYNQKINNPAGYTIRKKIRDRLEILWVPAVTHRSMQFQICVIFPSCHHFLYSVMSIGSFCDVTQVPAIFRIKQAFRDLLQLSFINVSQPVCDLLDTGNIQSLPLLDRRNEV